MRLNVGEWSVGLSLYLPSLFYNFYLSFTNNPSDKVIVIYFHARRIPTGSFVFLILYGTLLSHRCGVSHPGFGPASNRFLLSKSDVARPELASSFSSYSVFLLTGAISYTELTVCCRGHCDITAFVIYLF